MSTKKIFLRASVYGGLVNIFKNAGVFSRANSPIKYEHSRRRRKDVNACQRLFNAFESKPLTTGKSALHFRKETFRASNEVLHSSGDPLLPVTRRSPPAKTGFSLVETR